MPGHALAGINLLDTATHTWDLATATGQPAALPDDVATAALEASRATITPEIRPGRFGPEVAAPAGAAGDRRAGRVPRPHAVTRPTVGTRDECPTARLGLLAREKELTASATSSPSGASRAGPAMAPHRVGLPLRRADGRRTLTSCSTAAARCW